MLKAILFDLDGTLLALDIEVFIKNYFQKLGLYFQEYVDPKIFIQELLKATEKMISNSGPQTNEEVFMAEFLPAIKRDSQEMKPLFEEFYQEEFPKLAEEGLTNPLAKEIVGLAVRKGYDIVLATNPLFPKIAIEHRMDWAGVRNKPWKLVTSYEEFRSAKPSTNYFQEIALKIGLSPSDCLMIGNDVQEDMLAGEIGMSTFLVTDYLIDRGSPQYVAGHRGNLLELRAFISNLPEKPED